MTTIKTAVPLEEVRKIIGANPWVFNGFSMPEIQVHDGCVGIWRTNLGETVSIQDLAIAVRQAEKLIENVIGFNILPKYLNQTLYPDRITGTHYPIPQTIQTRKRGYLLELGSEKRELLGTFPIVRKDQDLDGFEELGTLNISSFANVDVNQLHFFYTNRKDEIRPVNIVDTGQVRTAEFPMYMVPKWELRNNLEQEGLDYLDVDHYETEVDVYRIYTDTTKQIKLGYNAYPGCTQDCDKTYVETCGYITEQELGFIAYNPLNYTKPDEVQVNFLSGYKGDNEKPLVDIDSMFIMPVSALAVSLLDPSKTCCGDNDPSLVSHWRTDLTLSDRDIARVVVEPLLLTHFGVTTMGAYFAYKFTENLRLFPF